MLELDRGNHFRFAWLSTPWDSFTLQLGSASYHYDCAYSGGASGGANAASPRLRTTGCGWPTSNPGIEIDLALQRGLGPAPLENVTIDLSQPDAYTKVSVSVGVSAPNNPMNESIYASSLAGGGGNAPGTTGTVLIKSFDGAPLDATCTGVKLAASTFNQDPGAPSTLTIDSAAFVRWSSLTSQYTSIDSPSEAVEWIQGHVCGQGRNHGKGSGVGES